MHKEKVFINYGELHKEITPFSEDSQLNSYVYDGIDPVFTSYKQKEGSIKRYLSTKEFREYLNIKSMAPSADMSFFDLCPAVPMWAGIGGEKGGLIDLYFNCRNSTILKEVAEYYKLPYPIDEEMTVTLDTNPSEISGFFKEDDEFVLCSVRLINRVPTLLKFHAVYKDLGRYFLFNRGRVFLNGKVVEQGGFYKAANLPNLYISEGEGFKVKYQSSYKGDGFADFEGLVTYEDGTTAVKTYESSRMVRLALAKSYIGSDFPEYPKAPIVKWWLGRSILGTEEELFFHVENKEMLDAVCGYYQVPVPYDEELKNALINNPHSIRFKSYDLNGQGPGNFVEILLASVVFNNKVPVGVKFYETRRPDE